MGALMVLLEVRFESVGSVRVACEIGVLLSAGACSAVLTVALTGKRRVRVEYRTRRILSLV